MSNKAKIAVFDKRITTSAQRGVYIVYLLNKEDINCLNCGLCSYVCPSRINFKKITKKVDANE